MVFIVADWHTIVYYVSNRVDEFVKVGLNELFVLDDLGLSSFVLSLLLQQFDTRVLLVSSLLLAHLLANCIPLLLELIQLEPHLPPVLINSDDFIHNFGVLVALDARLPYDVWVTSFLHPKQVDI